MSWFSEFANDAKKKTEQAIMAPPNPILETQKKMNEALGGVSNWWNKQDRPDIGARTQEIKQSGLFTGAGTPWSAGNQNTWWDYARGFGSHTNPTDIARNYKRAKERWDQGEGMDPEMAIGLSLQGGHGSSLELGGTERENQAVNNRLAYDTATAAQQKRDFEKYQSDKAAGELAADIQNRTQTGIQQARVGSLAEAMLSGARKKRGRILWG